MLVQFSVRNYKSFREENTLSMIASSYDKNYLENENVFIIDNYNHRLVKSVAMYGANASGKTKFLDALAFMRWFVINSSTKTQEGDEIEVDPFRLNSTSIKDTTEFEIIFIANNSQYRYGYELNNKKIISEWLFQKKINSKPKEVELFYRDKKKIDFHKSFAKINTLNEQGEIIRDNALILSVSNQFKVKEAKLIINWFEENIKLLLGNEPRHYEMFSKSQIAENTQLGKDIVEIIRRFDTGIDEIKVEKINPNNLPEDLSPEILKELKKVLTKEKDATIIETEILHKTYDDDYNPVGYQSFDFSDDESAGTQKLFSIIGPILDTLQNGYILVIDELDSRLHPSIVNHIINLFNSNITNPKNAQFIFNTHNTNLLNEDIFRRDQIWFVEKNRYNESKVYSLADIKVRKEENFEQKYLNGRYGGVPFIENIADVLKHFSND